MLRKGRPIDILSEIAEETKAKSLYFNRCYEPHALSRDKEIQDSFVNKGLECEVFNSALLAEPWELKTQGGNNFRVFTPFWKTLQNKKIPKPVPVPDMNGYAGDVFSENLDDWRFQPTNWGSNFPQHWQPGEEGALKFLDLFLEDHVEHYETQRDFPAIRGTSHLSPHIHFGEIGPRQVYHVANARNKKSCTPWIRQLAWREFCYHLLYYFPEMATRPLRPAFDNFAWRTDDEALRKWQKGKTGYPIIDAGMRELWDTGYLHNRLRMLVASFLTKHLLIPWQEGEKWFWDTLADADMANNSGGWQWVAGCGTDSSPYFRIFNPIIQGEKFDADGEYVRRWVPELAGLPNSVIHKPWLATAAQLKKAGVILDQTYPRPIVNHEQARKEALDAYRGI